MRIVFHQRRSARRMPSADRELVGRAFKLLFARMAQQRNVFSLCYIFPRQGQRFWIEVLRASLY